MNFIDILIIIANVNLYRWNPLILTFELAPLSTPYTVLTLMELNSSGTTSDRPISPVPLEALHTSGSLILGHVVERWEPGARPQHVLDGRTLPRGGVDERRAGRDEGSLEER